MGQAVRRGIWGERLTWLALGLSVGAVVAALIAAVGSGQGAWHFGDGFTILRYAFFAAIAAAVLAVVAFLVSRRVDGPKRGGLNLLALAVALAFILYLGSQIRTARTMPAIHDISTNLDDMPQFAALSVRADNLENVPDMGRPELAAMTPEERWKALHREAYSNLRTIEVPWSVSETIRRAEAVARERGWDVARSDPGAGILEATATTFFFRFKDDVVVRARPGAPGSGTTFVDMRSISRVGGSDVGVNAKRIRSFLKDLRQ